MIAPRPAAIRFWEKVNPEGECWIWTGYLMRKNYGQFRGADGRTILAHRMSWLLAYGRLPEDQCVLHICDEPRCVRPDHLFLGSREDNNRDMARKNRHWRGKPAAKITQRQADEIRSRSANETRMALANEYGISRQAVNAVLTTNDWGSWR